MNDLWRIELLGGLRVRQGDRIITRFRTQKVAALLAYLAYHTDRSHSRELLIEQFWPESNPQAGRASLSVALSSLRHQLEPPGTFAATVIGTVIAADRFTIGIHPGTLTTDVADFEATLHKAGQTAGRGERIELLARAADLYQGPLLPGFYQAWVTPEKERLTGLFMDAVTRLTTDLEKSGDLLRALTYARRAVAVDSLHEEAHLGLIRLLVAAGQPEAAERQYKEMERLLETELGETPSAAARALAEQMNSLSPTRAPAATRVGSLPLFLTHFFGREDEMARLSRVLREPEVRLVTLTGPGGSGKTRLAVETARRLWQTWDGAVWFVPLASLSDPRRIIEAIGDALGLPPPANAGSLAALLAARQPALLVLDNFEHLTEEGAPLIRELLAQTPSLTCLVTSRQELLLDGERVQPLLPLPTPSPEASPEQLMALASVQLFVDRAQAARPDFQVTSRNAGAVATLCAALEGIPLALELAAAWAPVLTPTQMRDRLSRRFELLATRRMDREARHRSLWAAMAWSFDLLPLELGRFFARLSVFHGGWTAEAAETICEEDRALDFLAQLRERSLVTVEERPEGMRFRMLETVREFAQEQVNPEEYASQKHRHAHYFAGLAERAGREMTSPQESGLPQEERYDAERENFRAALDGAIECGDVEMGMRLGAALWWFWSRGHITEGRERMMRLLAEKSEPTEARARALTRAGLLAIHQGDPRGARPLLEESLAICRTACDEENLATTLNILGSVMRAQGDYEAARAHLEESLVLRRKQGGLYNIAVVLCNLAEVASLQGDAEAARAHCAEAITLWRTLNRSIAWPLRILGRVAEGQGDYAEARALYEQVLAAHRRQNVPRNTATTLCEMASVVFRQGDYEAARALLAESLTLRREIADKQGISDCLGTFARFDSAQGRMARAARLLSASEALRADIDYVPSPTERAEHDRTVSSVRAALGKEAFAAAWAQGQAAAWEQAVTHALEEDTP